MNKKFYIIGFLALLAFDTLTQISIKYASMSALPMEYDIAWFVRVLETAWIYIALGGYFGSFISWMTLLKHAPVGPSFAASHLEIVSVTLLSVWLFHEPMTMQKVIGGLLILLGVFCLAQSKPQNK